MYYATVSQSHDWKRFCRCRLIALGLLGLLSFFGCFQGLQVQEDNNIASSSKVRPIDVDTSIVEKIGQEALEKIGYDEIIILSEKAGFVEQKMTMNVQLASNGSVFATGFARVFSRYAFTAAVTSQADSPLPGPADIAALGVLVIGLVDAGLLDGYLIKSIGKLIVATSEATLPATATTAVPDTPIPDDRSDCQAHLTKCMETSARRGRRGSGSDPGQSICVDCFRQCKTLRGWPDKTFEGKDCQWWDGR